MILSLEEVKKYMKNTETNSLSLRNKEITELPDNLTVVGNLDLYGTNIPSLPRGLIVGGSLGLYGTNITSLPNDLIVGGSLWLRRTKIKKLPDNLTIGGDLDLSCAKIEVLPQNLTIGGNLNLNGTEIKELPNTLKIGSEKKVYSNNYDFPNPPCQKLKNGNYVPGKYIYADKILTHIKGERKIKDYTYYQGKIKGQNVIFDGKNYAHCKNFKDGVLDLRFKEAKDRGIEQYKHLSLDSEIKTEELITMYRVITGACKQGTTNFVASLGDNLKKTYTIREAIRITKGQYNAKVFKAFFAK